MMMISVFH